MKKELMEVTRRDFLRTTAMLTATAATSRAAEFAVTQESAAVAGSEPLPQVHDVPLGSVFPYGAVYFRKTNPPEQDWARDHQTASRVGMNTFRHWFFWGAIEIAPGKFDWSDYDRMMDLAAANGIKVVIAELVTCAPEWAFHKYASARYKSSDGSVEGSNNSGLLGGFPGLCLDNPDAREAAERFLTALVEHYRSHPALLGYDLWNENSYNGGEPRKMNCYCDGTKAHLREWLRNRYGTLEAVGKTWNRFGYQTWEDVDPPTTLGGYSESLDWLEFRIDDAFRLLEWRVKLFRKLDPHHLITAHGVAGSLEALPNSANNEWRSAAMVDVWGFTWVASRKGNAPWQQYQTVDLVRAGARGKPFWHAEAEAGPLWMQPQVIGRPREDGRQPDAEDVRIWNLVSCAGGVRGILYPRWRPLLDSALFGAFGAFGMDGSVTPRAEMAGRIAKWTNSQPKLWQSRPVKGDVGLLFVTECQLFNYVMQGTTDYYSHSMRGAYQAFFDSNIQPDFVRLEDVDEYKLIYLAYPVMLKKETVEKLKSYVQRGGTLISEGVPAYFGDHGHVGTVQPNFGLDQLFGAREKEVEFDPDLSEQLMFEVNGKKIYGRYFRQDYDLHGGKAAGHYSNGNIAAVSNTFGRGKTLLIGSFPGAGYFLHHGAPTKELFAEFLEFAGTMPAITIDDPSVQARLHQGTGGTHIWVTNSNREAKTVTVTLATGIGTFQSAEDVWGGQKITQSGQRFTMTVSQRDAVVASLT
jgi:beta-galactosidase